MKLFNLSELVTYLNKEGMHKEVIQVSRLKPITVEKELYVIADEVGAFLTHPEYLELCIVLDTTTLLGLGKRKSVVSAKFEHIGWHLDYYVNKKYIGSVDISEPDRNVFGYMGRRESVLAEDLILLNGKKIKAGTQVRTELIPLCGKAVKE